MNKPNNNRRGRSASAKPNNVVPLPRTPSPCDVVDDELCYLSDDNHIQQQQHQQNVLNFLTVEWSVAPAGARNLLRKHGITALNQAAQELAEREYTFGNILNRGGFAVFYIREIARDLTLIDQAITQFHNQDTTHQGDPQRNVGNS